MYTYYMPTECFVGELTGFAPQFAGFGSSALIVTGSSSVKNGSLDDVTNVLKGLGVTYSVFDGVEENPSIQNAEDTGRAALDARAAFIIGIGGGSPMDAAKAAAVLAASPGLTGDGLYNPNPLPALPVLLVPTTAGTGSETTPYSILTDHNRRTKSSIPQKIFARKAFLDSRYTASMPESVTLSSAVDALTHLIEGYTSAGANFLSDGLATSGLASFARCMDGLTARRFTPELRETLLLISAQAGMVIAQAKTTLPHLLGYALTYYKNIPHGFACGMMTTAYLNSHTDKARVKDVLRLLGLNDVNELDAFLRGVMPTPPALTDGEANDYANAALADRARLKNCPFDLTLEDIAGMYAKL